MFVVVAVVSWPMARAVAQGSDELFDMRAAPRSLPDLSFVDAEGRSRSLADYAGKVVVLNVWATWCAPCRQELPALDRVRDELGGPGFEVIALSTDPVRSGAVQRLYRELDLDEAGIFIDASGSAMRDLGIFALPTTLLIDADGREIGRVTGTATWDSPAALAFFRAAMFDPAGDGAVRLP